MIYRAKFVATMDGPPLENGAVAVADDEIVDVGSIADVRARNHGEVTDLGEVVLLPGLINAHCHLDFTILRQSIAPQPTFADWIRQIVGKRDRLTDDDFLQSIAAGFRESRRCGTTTIANVESLPHLLRRMGPPPLRTWWFCELLDVRTAKSVEEILNDALSLGERTADWPGGFGLSPHALYTASAELSRAAAATGLPLMMHVAESHEEMEMFRDGRGPLFDLLQSLGRPMTDCGRGKTPLQILLERQPVDERSIIVHLNELTEQDFARLASGPRFHIAHCPRSGRYFGHQPFAMDRLRDLSLNICLGTDSLASNSSLSLLAEMQAVRDTWPGLPPREILEMTTTNPARALQQPDRLGRIAPGFQADLIALPITGAEDDLFEEIIAWAGPIEWMMLRGKPPPG